MRTDSLRRLIILVFGSTGVGKSTIINLLTNDAFQLPVGDSLASCTQNISVASIPYKNREIVFYDTPGFDDSKISPAMHLKHLSTTLAEMYEDNHQPHIHGILYVHRITDNKVSGSALTNLRIFQNLIGEKACKNLVFVTNRWTDPPNPKHERFEEELISNDKYFGKAVKEGARAGPEFRIKEDASYWDAQHTLLDLFLDYDPIITQNQQEIVDQDIPPDQTKAGQVVNEELNKLKADTDAKIKFLADEIAGLEEREVEAREEGKRALADLQKVKEDAERAQAALKESYDREVRRLRRRRGFWRQLGRAVEDLFA